MPENKISVVFLKCLKNFASKQSVTFYLKSFAQLLPGCMPPIILGHIYLGYPQPASSRSVHSQILCQLLDLIKHYGIRLFPLEYNPEIT